MSIAHCPLPIAHIYVHVPFCARRCTYCDFSIAVRSRTPVREYLDALSTEIGRSPRPTPHAPRTIYLGGGTPSRLGGDGIAGVIGLFDTSNAEELTIEANPEDVTPEQARAWARAGVNRLSLGSQSFDEGVLRWMHRTHDAAAIGAAVRAARGAGIANISLDLIFALPESLGRDLVRDLGEAVALEPDHISLYGLTVEARTPLARQIARGATRAPGDARYEDEYLMAHDRLGAAGFRFYEVSNAAREGRESRHNSAYWQQVPYFGLGPSAHSFDGNDRWWNEPAYRSWTERLARGESPVAGRESLTPEERETEQWYLGLRTLAGVLLPWQAPVALEMKVKAWVRAGWASLDETTRRLKLTPAGWLRLDELVASV